MHIAPPVRLPSAPLGIICRQFTLRLSLRGETRALLLTFNLIRSAGEEKLSRLFLMKTVKNRKLPLSIILMRRRPIFVCVARGGKRVFVRRRSTSAS
jgi:hypothetical protein